MTRMLRSAVERSLPRAAYLDAAFLEVERERIFHREWFCVGRAETLVAPGDYLLVDVAGESVLVVRSRNGLHALVNLCRHRGSRLVAGETAPVGCDVPTADGRLAGVIRCPYHSWTYELDGRVRHAPFLGEGETFFPDEFALHPVGLATWGGFLFVNLDPALSVAATDPEAPVTSEPGRSLAQQLGGIPARLVRYPLADLLTARRIVYDVAANWKVVAENYNECYHCAGVHPELCRIVPAFREAGGANLDWDEGIPQAEGTFTLTFTGRSDRAPFPGLSPEEQVRHKGELAYPNLMLSLSADHVAAFLLFPLGPERTRIVVDFLFHPDEIARPTFDPSDAADFWDLVNRQDWTVCEGVQAGMRSRQFEFGYYAPMEDLSLDIRRYVAEKLGDLPPPVTGRDHAVVVVGLGGLGSAAAYWLAGRLGRDVLGLEQFELGHVRGASEDHSRIVRYSYHRPDYVRLARRAFAAWAALEAAAGERLVIRTGGLDVFPPRAAIPPDGYLASLAAEAIPYELLDNREVMRRWPAWRLDAGTRGIFQADGGLVDAGRANAAHRRLAREHGATLLERTPVVALRPAAGEVDVVTADGTVHRAGSVVVAADAWTNDLLGPLGHGLPLVTTQEQVTYFAAPDAAQFAPDRFPAWIWMDDPSFYGVPVHGEAGPKAAQDAGGREVTPATRTFEPDAAAAGRLRSFLGRHLPGMAGPPIRTRTCLYTMPPDRDLIVDRLPDAPRVLVLQGAAHGFKFASLLGRIAAEMLVDGATPSAPDLAAFRIDRPALQDPRAPRRWLV